MFRKLKKKERKMPSFYLVELIIHSNLSNWQFQYKFKAAFNLKESYFPWWYLQWMDYFTLNNGFFRIRFSKWKFFRKPCSRIPIFQRIFFSNGHFSEQSFVRISFIIPKKIYVYAVSKNLLEFRRFRPHK